MRENSQKPGETRTEAGQRRKYQPNVGATNIESRSRVRTLPKTTSSQTYEHSEDQTARNMQNVVEAARFSKRGEDHIFQREAVR